MPTNQGHSNMTIHSAKNHAKNGNLDRSMVTLLLAQKWQPLVQCDPLLPTEALPGPCVTSLLPKRGNYIYARLIGFVLLRTKRIDQN